MNLDRYRLFAFDLDGTLLTRAGELAPSTVKLVKHITERAEVTLATGRSLASARRYLQELAIAVPAILYHGAVVFDPSAHQPLFESHIPGELARQVYEVAQKFPVHPQLYRSVNDPTIYVPRVTPPIEEFVRKEDLTASQVADFTNFLEQGPLKLLFIGDTSILPELADAVQRTLSELTVVRSGENYVEVLPPGVSKGEALSWLCDYLDIPLSCAVAVGDQMSDLSMIERAGLGVAMAHGTEELKRKADLVIERIEHLAQIL